MSWKICSTIQSKNTSNSGNWDNNCDWLELKYLWGKTADRAALVGRGQIQRHTRLKSNMWCSVPPLPFSTCSWKWNFPSTEPCWDSRTTTPLIPCRLKVDMWPRPGQSVVPVPLAMVIGTGEQVSKAGLIQVSLRVTEKRMIPFRGVTKLSGVVRVGVHTILMWSRDSLRKKSRLSLEDKNTEQSQVCSPELHRGANKSYVLFMLVWIGFSYLHPTWF